MERRIIASLRLSHSTDPDYFREWNDYATAEVLEAVQDIEITLFDYDDEKELQRKLEMIEARLRNIGKTFRIGEYVFVRVGPGNYRFVVPGYSDSVGMTLYVGFGYVDPRYEEYASWIFSELIKEDDKDDPDYEVVMYEDLTIDVREALG